MSQEAENLLYWIVNPLGAGELKVLATVKRGVIPSSRWRWWVARLIATECLQYDEGESSPLSITAKGEEGLAFFSEKQ